MKDLYNYGITDQDALNTIRNFDGDGMTAKETTAVFDKIGLNEIVVDGQLVIDEDLDGKFNKQAIIEWAEKNNVEIVDQYYGAEDTTILASSNEAILSAVTGDSGLNGSTQAVVNDLEAKVREGVKQYQANSPTSDSVGYKTEAQLIPIITKEVLKEFEENKLNPAHEHYIKDGIAVNSVPKGWFNRTNKKELAKLQNEASLSNFEKLSRNDNFDITNTKLLNTDQLTAIRTNQRSSDSRGRMSTSDKLPSYVLKMAAEAGVNPYEFVNNQAKLAGFEDWIPMVPSPQTQAILDGFKPHELATIYRMLPDNGSVNRNRPIKSLSYKLNAKVNTLLKSQGLTEIPSELTVFNSMKDMSTADWKTVGEGDNPGLGRFQILTSDVQAYYTRNGLKFNQAEFLDDHDLQETVFTDLISRVTSEAWDNAKVYKSGKNTTGSKNKAKTLRDIFNRIRYGSYIDYDQGQDLNSLHQGNLFMQNFSQY